MLPTFLGASGLTVPQVWTTIIGFSLLYGTLAVIEIGLMVRFIRRGPYAIHETAGEASHHPAMPPTPASAE